MVTLNKPEAGTTDWAGDLNDNWTTIESELVEHEVVTKTADETVNNSATLQNDDHLYFSIAANETWQGKLSMFAVAGSSTPQMKVAITVPAGASLKFGLADGMNAVDTSGSAIVVAVTNRMKLFVFWFSVENGGTGGTVQVQWAQMTATAVDTTVKEGSWLAAHREI